MAKDDDVVQNILTRLVTLENIFKKTIGEIGTGTCICKSAPDRNRYRNGTLVDDLNSNLDHRCPHHGETAQPAIWGRHKELTLYVTPAEWDSLGIKRNKA